MKFQVLLAKEAQKDFKNLSDEDQAILNQDYKNIATEGLQTVLTKNLDKGLFEIKTKHLRSLYGFQKDQIIMIAVIFVKDSQKTPKDLIKRAKKILKKYSEDL